MNRVRVFTKQEKRIVRLLYRKGFLKKYNINELYWESYRRAPSGVNYYPEVHFCTYDYWGECSEFGLVSQILDELFWAGVELGDRYTYYGVESSFGYRGRKWLIKYLEVLPTVICDNKINKLLKRITYN